MKISYKSVNGERNEIEVDDYWAEVIDNLDRIEANVNRKETRRHYSLDALDPKGELFSDGTDIEVDFIQRCDTEKVCDAINTLLPGQRDLVNKVYFERVSLADIARSEGVSKQSIFNRLLRIKNRIKKYCSVGADF